MQYLQKPEVICRAIELIIRNNVKELEFTKYRKSEVETKERRPGISFASQNTHRALFNIYIMHNFMSRNWKLDFDKK